MLCTVIITFANIVYYVLNYNYLFRPVASCRFQLATTLHRLVHRLYASYYYLGV